MYAFKSTFSLCRIYQLAISVFLIFFRQTNFMFYFTEYISLFFCTNSIAVSKLHVIRRLNIM